MTTAERRSSVTILVEGVAADTIKCTAHKAFTIGNLSIAEGQAFFLVKSGSDASRYYVVTWQQDMSVWRCSCGAGRKTHAHTKAVKGWIVAHVVAKVPGVTTATRTIQTHVTVTPTHPAQATPDMLHSSLNGNRGFSLYR